MQLPQTLHCLSPSKPDFSLHGPQPFQSNSPAPLPLSTCRSLVRSRCRLSGKEASQGPLPQGLHGQKGKQDGDATNLRAWGPMPMGGGRRRPHLKPRLSCTQLRTATFQAPQAILFARLRLLI